MDAIGDENVALQRRLELLPVTMRKANTTFVNLRTTLDDLELLVEESKPATRELAPFFRELRPLVADLRPTIADLRTLIRQPGAEQRPDRADLEAAAARELTAPSSRARSETLDEAQPVIAYARHYTPDLAGWFTKFGQVRGVLRRQRPLRARHAGLQPGAAQRATTRSRRSPPSSGSRASSAACSATAPAARCSRRPTAPPRSPAARAATPTTRRPAHEEARLHRRVVGDPALDRDRHRARGRRRGREGGTTSCARSSTTRPTLVPGEDVKIAGATVGVIVGLDVTPEKQAAVTLRIDDEGFAPFKADAHCIIRLQGLIGEKFVECEPGSSDAKELARNRGGRRRGRAPAPGREHELARRPRPAEQHPAAALPGALLDPAQRARNRPRRARRGAQRGHPPRESGAARDRRGAGDPRRPEPGAGQARADSDGRWPRCRASGSASRTGSSRRTATGEASAERREDIARGIDRLPAFLRELRLLMVDLEGLADQGTPLLATSARRLPTSGG